MEAVVAAVEVVAGLLAERAEGTRRAVLRLEGGFESFVFEAAVFVLLDVED